MQKELGRPLSKGAVDRAWKFVRAIGSERAKDPAARDALEQLGAAILAFEGPGDGG